MVEAQALQEGVIIITNIKITVEEGPWDTNNNPVRLLKKETTKMISSTPNRNPKTAVLCDFCNKTTDPFVLNLDRKWGNSPLISGWMCRLCLGVSECKSCGSTDIKVRDESESVTWEAYHDRNPWSGYVNV